VSCSAQPAYAMEGEGSSGAATEIGSEEECVLAPGDEQRQQQLPNGKKPGGTKAANPWKRVNIDGPFLTI